MPSDSVTRQIHRHSIHDKERRYYSRMPLFEAKIDPEKERRSILMSRFPSKKQKGKSSCTQAPISPNPETPSSQGSEP